MHSFLLIGQSNAAGRGLYNEAPPLYTADGKIRVMRNGLWQRMYRPVNPDRDFSGTCLAESFAKCHSDKYPEEYVGIIPCADGGTSLSQWMPGEILFDNAVNCARLAMRTSKLVGILWHQGEGDCSPNLYPHYAENFKIMIDALRRQLNLPEVPVIIGGLGDFLADCPLSGGLKNYVYVNEQLVKCEKEVPLCKFVSAEGLGSNPDFLHFNAQALYEFGLRYYDAFSTFDISSLIKEDIDANIERSKMEEL